MIVLGLVGFAAALWLVGVRDWRVYGVIGLWPQVAGEMRVSHLTPLLCVLAALAWRTRHERLAPGVAVGVAVAMKFFAWPLGLWLAARRSYAAALLAVAIGGASLLLVLPFTPLDDYIRVLLQLGRGFDQDAYTIFGLVVQSGGSETAGRIATFAVGAALLAGTWRYRSFTLALAAALVLSPIVWLDYFAVALVPLAIVRPRLSLVWFLPLATWGVEGAGIGIGDAAGSREGAARLPRRLRPRVRRRAAAAGRARRRASVSLRRRSRDAPRRGHARPVTSRPGLPARVRPRGSRSSAPGRNARASRSGSSPRCAMSSDRA